MITIELTEDEALSLRNLLDVAVRHEGMRAAIFAVTLDAKNRVKAIQRPRFRGAFSWCVVGGSGESPAAWLE